MASVAVAVLGTVGGLLFVTGVTGLVLWTQRHKIARNIVKRFFGLDSDLKDLTFELKWRPLRLLVSAENVTIYTPPGLLKEDIAVRVPRVFAVVKKLDADSVKRTGHKWSVEGSFHDMQVHYVFLKLGETNFDRIVKRIVKEKAEEIPPSHRTKEVEALAAEQGKSLPKKDEEAPPEAIVVSKLSLKGRSKIILRAGNVPMMPPIVLSEITVDPEVLKNPAGLFLWINSVVLHTLENRGIDLVNLVASSAYKAGLVVAGTPVSAVKGMVKGGQTALTFTFNGISGAAAGTVQAGNAFVSGTVEGAVDMMKQAGLSVGSAIGTAGTAVAGVGGAAVGGVASAGRATFETGSRAATGLGRGVYGAGNAVFGAVGSTVRWPRDSAAPAAAEAPPEGSAEPLPGPAEPPSGAVAAEQVTVSPQPRPPAASAGGGHGAASGPTRGAGDAVAAAGQSLVSGVGQAFGQGAAAVTGLFGRRQQPGAKPA